MIEPRKPIFGFLWPESKGPVDADFHQSRLVRVAGRGPWRIAGLGVLSAGTVAWLGSVLMAALATGVSAVAVIGAAVGATLLVLTMRAWVVGTYVNDAGLRIERTWGRSDATWPEVEQIAEERQRVPVLGAPLPVPGRRCTVRLTTGKVLATHVYTTSPDLWLRPEAYDMARLRLERWQRAG